jgi:excinuclease ABC subunit B
MYADSVTPSMQRAIDETDRRRVKQLAYNKERSITPQTIRKAIKAGIEEEILARRIATEAVGKSNDELSTQEYLNQLEAEMLSAAEQLEFERAAKIRDKIAELKGSGMPAGKSSQMKKSRRRRGGGKQAIPRPKKMSGP